MGVGTGVNVTVGVGTAVGVGTGVNVAVGAVTGDSSPPVHAAAAKKAKTATARKGGDVRENVPANQSKANNS